MALKKYKYTMDPDILLQKGIDTYNIWYKLWDTKSYNAKAYEYFKKAKSKYTIEQKYNKTAECFDWMIKCISDDKDLVSMYDICKLYEEYAELLLNKLKDEEKAIIYYEITIEKHIDNSNLNGVAKIKEKLGEHYKSKSNYQKSIEMYSHVLELNSNKNYSYMKINKILFELYILIKNFEKAFDIYNALTSNDKVNPYSNIDFIFGAMLTYIIIDFELSDVKYKQYCSSCPAFTNDRKGKFIKSIINSLKYNDISEFENNVHEFELTSKLSNIDAILILEIKKLMSDEMSLL